jgi:hypothetical protein
VSAVEDAVDSNFRRAAFERLGITFTVAWTDGRPVVLIDSPAGGAQK